MKVRADTPATRAGAVFYCSRTARLV